MKKIWRYRLGAFLLAAGLFATGSFAGCGREQMAQTRETQGVEESRETEETQEAEESQETGEARETEGNQETGEAREAEENQETEEIQESGEFPGGGGQEDASSREQVSENGSYTSKDEVAEYIATYGHLPGNFITKKEAKALGWVSSEGNLGEVAPGKSIGGDYFGNFEGNLPEKEGREYHECDIDSDGGYRGAKRIVYSNDGLIYYTEDHYETFELLYGEE